MSEIKPYTELEKELHHEIQTLITSDKYKQLSADDCLRIFGRVYSVYALDHLREVGVIEFKDNVPTIMEELEKEAAVKFWTYSQIWEMLKRRFK